MKLRDSKTPASTATGSTTERSSNDVIASAATLVASRSSGGATHTTVPAIEAGAPISVDEVREPAALTMRDPDRYRRGAEIARGGMGRIVSVYDRELERDLAIKELLSSSPALERRFEREVRITARLQHPSIIGVLEAGRWPSGEPFFTMKKVAGRPFGVLIGAATSLADRLALLPNLIAVTDALAYAHSQGIIHRDLKPANVLVGDFGETVVIDWGLAKDLSLPGSAEPPPVTPSAAGDDDLTMVGAAMGTPAYMAPEQARGEEVDERADVYALGAMLYHLLAGKMPYLDHRPASTDQLLDWVKERAPTLLAEVEPGVPRDLSTLVSKAMARDLRERYPDAVALADDLKRFATGQLVGAHHYSSWQLIARWFGRHRAVVGVAAVMVALLLGGAGVSFTRIAKERDRAEQAQAVAEESRSEVEDLADFMLGDLHDKLEPLGKVELLDMVARKAAAYYDTRPIDWSRPAEARKRATVHRNVGDVLQLRGDLGGALAQYQAGVTIARRLCEEDSDNRELQWHLSESCDRLGWLLFAQGDLGAALEQLREALAIRRRLVEREAENLAWQPGLAESYERIGEVLKGQGDLDGALQHHRAGFGIRERLAKQRPEEVRLQRELAVGHIVIGTVLREQGDLDGALAQHRAAFAIRARLAAERPGDARWQQELAQNHVKLGDVLQAQGGIEAALQEYRAALAIREQLVRQDPSNSLWQRDLAFCYGAIGSVLLARGESAEGAKLLDQSSDIYAANALVANDFYNAACMSAIAGNTDRAFALLHTAVERGWRRATLMEQDPDLVELRKDPRWIGLLDQIAAASSGDDCGVRGGAACGSPPPPDAPR